MMATLETSQDAATQETRIKELTEENELLFEQLHVVQEELEKYYYKLKECEQSKDQTGGGTLVAASPQAAEALAENRKLHALVEQQKIALRVEAQNSLAARLGEMLIKGVSSAGSLFALAVRLRKIWKALDRTIPPAELGGQTFQKVIDAHSTGGPEAVEKLLDSVFISSVMRANAYTALARHLMLTDALRAAANARLAWETDPRPYRLKWLAFRLHDADDAVAAEAMLDMLPVDVSMSESEERQAMRIRYESKRERQGSVKSETAFAETRQVDDHRLKELTQEVEKFKREAEQAHAKQEKLQKQADTQKNESNALAVQTARMLKNLLTQFESDKAVLSKMMRVVMGVSVNR